MHAPDVVQNDNNGDFCGLLEGFYVNAAKLFEFQFLSQNLNF